MTLNEILQVVITVATAVGGSLFAVARFARSLEKRVDRHEHTLYGNGLKQEVALVRDRTHPIPSHSMVLTELSARCKDLDVRLRDVERRA